MQYNYIRCARQERISYYIGTGTYKWELAMAMVIVHVKCHTALLHEREGEHTASFGAAAPTLTVCETDKLVKDQSSGCYFIVLGLPKV
jgi:hypothetical protein